MGWIDAFIRFTSDTKSNKSAEERLEEIRRIEAGRMVKPQKPIKNPVIPPMSTEEWLKYTGQEDVLELMKERKSNANQTTQKPIQLSDLSRLLRELEDAEKVPQSNHQPQNHLVPEHSDRYKLIPGIAVSMTSPAVVSEDKKRLDNPPPPIYENPKQMGPFGVEKPGFWVNRRFRRSEGKVVCVQKGCGYEYTLTEHMGARVKVRCPQCSHYLSITW